MNDATPSAASLHRQLGALLPELRGFARFLVRDTHAADDLVQDCVVRALAALDQFQEGSNLRAWLFTIQRNIFYEQVRRRRTERRAIEATAPAPEAAQLADGHAPAQEAHAALRDVEKLLWALPPLLREAVVLVGAQGLNYEEAASICSVPVGTMKARVSRARRLLATEAAIAKS